MSFFDTGNLKKSSSADLMGFSANRAYLMRRQSMKSSPLLRHPVNPINPDSRLDHEDLSATLARKQSTDIRGYMDQLRNPNVAGGVEPVDFNVRSRRQTLLNIFRWILLILSIIGGASFGPFMLGVEVPIILKAAWRMEITVILLIPFVIYEKYKDKTGQIFNRQFLFNRSVVQRLVVASLGNAFWMISLLYALNYTSVAHAYLFNCMPTLLVVIWRRIRGISSGKLELLGTLMAIAGAVTVATDDTFLTFKHVDLTTVNFWTRFLQGDMVALVGSFFAAFFFVLNGEIREEYPLYFGITFISLIGAIFMIILALIFQGASFGFSSTDGIFGLFSGEWILYFICVGLVTGIGYYVIYSYIANHLHPLLVTVALYFEPVVSSLIVYLLGWQSLPAFFAIIGGLMVIVGLILVALGQNNKDQMSSIPEYDENNVELDSYY